ncbi:MAG: aldehyde dehydrogenase family protein, partial [Intrasporangium sp.]|uniref:aldehyde dehydrogenase family protein n=1 Tax=Intrasporangium sp. TaxID=1925024 RepID=UPI003F7EE92E
MPESPLYRPAHPAGLPVGEGWFPPPETAEVRFPYDGALVAEAPVGDRDLARQAVDAALAVRDRVGRLPSHVRRAALFAAHAELAARRSELEDLLVLETGKPRVDCRVEL